MGDSEIDWARATLIGAVAGGAFWALTAFSVVRTDGSPVTMAVCTAVGAAAILVGLVALRRAVDARRRGTALGAVLAPLTGAAAVVPFVAVALLMELATGGVR